MISLADSSTLNSSRITFKCEDTEAELYDIYTGDSELNESAFLYSTYNIYVGEEKQYTSVVVNNLPTDGRSMIYLTLWSKINA